MNYILQGCFAVSFSAALWLGWNGQAVVALACAILSLVFGITVRAKSMSGGLFLLMGPLGSMLFIGSVFAVDKDLVLAAILFCFSLVAVMLPGLALFDQDKVQTPPESMLDRMIASHKENKKNRLAQVDGPGPEGEPPRKLSGRDLLQALFWLSLVGAFVCAFGFDTFVIAFGLVLIAFLLCFAFPNSSVLRVRATYALFGVLCAVAGLTGVAGFLPWIFAFAFGFLALTTGMEG